MKKKSNSKSAFFTFRVLVVVVLCLLAVVLTLFGPGIMSGPSALAQGTNQRAAASHKLSVRGRHLAESLKSRGAHVVADYGSFVLLEANDALANSVAGNASAARVYSITQDNGTNKVAFGDCENPAQVTTPGQVQSIEISTVTISNTLPVGICPVYGIASSDNYRTFILNRGSGTVTVINSQLNALDNTANRQNLNSATGALTLPPPSGTS